MRSQTTMIRYLDIVLECQKCYMICRLSDAMARRSCPSCGLGIANWEAYRATIREDIAHLPGYDVERASKMSDAEVEALLDETNGILALENMEHADDVMLELAGICSRDRVTVWRLRGQRRRA